jgi:hypothetical protein
MPLVEGHWQRQQTPLRRLTQRERRLLAGFLAALALASAAAVAYAVLHRATPVPAGCIEVTAPSTVGAVNLRVCGPAAVARFCREQAGRDDPTARAAHERCRAYAASRTALSRR